MGDRRTRIAAVAAAAVAAVAAGGYAAWAMGSGGSDAAPAPPTSTGRSALPPATTQARTATTQAAPKPRHRRPPKPPAVDGGPDWPVYGLDVAHTRDASRFSGVRPPFRQIWRRHQYGTLEFPPSYHKGVLYVSTDAGWLRALRLRDGRVLWEHHLSMLPSQVAYARGMVVIGDMRLARVFAYDAGTGRLRWSMGTGQAIESSPIVVGGSVYIGGNAGTVWAIRLRSGTVRWRLTAPGPVKASPTFWHGSLYFGDYSGHVTRVRPSDGSIVWQSAVNGPVYASVAAADGRLFLGTNAGSAYALSAATGGVLWSVAMGGYSYSSPAISRGIAYFASFNGQVAAVRASSGAVLWRRSLGLPTLSSPTRIGPLVYVADRGEVGGPGRLHAFEPTTGREVWRFGDGKYSSVVVADRMLVVAGLAHLYLLDPKGDHRGLFPRRTP